MCSVLFSTQISISYQYSIFISFKYSNVIPTKPLKQIFYNKSVVFVKLGNFHHKKDFNLLYMF